MKEQELGVSALLAPGASTGSGAPPSLRLPRLPRGGWEAEGGRLGLFPGSDTHLGRQRPVAWNCKQLLSASQAFLSLKPTWVPVQVRFEPRGRQQVLVS